MCPQVRVLKPALSANSVRGQEAPSPWCPSSALAPPAPSGAREAFERSFVGETAQNQDADIAREALSGIYGNVRRKDDSRRRRRKGAARGNPGLPPRRRGHNVSLRIGQLLLCSTVKRSQILNATVAYQLDRDQPRRT